MFITLRIFDGYVTSFLGMPRNLRVMDSTSNFTDAPYVASLEMLTAANANMDLLEILSETRESNFFTNITTPIASSNVISAVRLEELSMTLDRWAMKYHLLTGATNNNHATSSK